MNDTIVAIATPPGNAGVGIVRISGENALTVAQKLTKSKHNFKPNQMYLKTLYLDNFSDNAFVVFFVSPKSFTGENVVEVQAHGGYFLLQKIVSKCIEYGCRLALAGEFSKRAFINGKMDIEQAEGIIDLINAETTIQAKMASDLISGELGKIITENQNKLTDMLAQLETALDYPEYEFENDEIANLKSETNEIIKNLSNLYATHPDGMLLKNGVKVAIVGEPNVGKSSLLNVLCGSEKAIVTDVAGTTRDIVEGRFEYKGIIFNLYDTAGLRESGDLVEKLGIEKAKRQMENADIILHVTDSSKISDLQLNFNIPVIKVLNKADLVENENIKTDGSSIAVSALKNENIDELKEKIFNLVVAGGYDSSKLYLTNLRHIECVKNAIESLKTVSDKLGELTIDFLISDIKSAWEQLGQITGRTATDEIIDRIFSKFCLGK